jgi:D-alanyl-D-alanine carboxypeptidase
VNRKVFDTTTVDPSMAGAAGGHALVTTARDLVRFLDALLAGRLFRHPETLRQMLTFAPAPDVGGQVGYGLGIERRVIPGGAELIGHLGGAGGYFAYVGRLTRPKVTLAAAMNSSADPSPLLLPVFQALAKVRR